MLGATAVKTLRPVYINDTLNDETYGAATHFIARHGFRSLVVLPVLFQEHLFGALTLYYHAPRQFSDFDIQVGMTLAHTLAISYQNAKLYQAESRQRELAEALIQAAAVINKSLNLDDVLDHILEQIMRVIPCTATNIVLVENEQIVLTHQRGDNRFFLSQVFFENINELMQWHTYRTMYTQQETVFIPDTWNDPHWRKEEDTWDIRSYIGIPLIIGDRVVGFLNIDSNQPNALSMETLPQLQTFAGYAAVAIENARLYSHIAQRAEENAALLSVASALTRSLHLSDVLQVISVQLISVFGVQSCSILDYDADEMQLELLFHYHRQAGHLSPDVQGIYDLRQFPLVSGVLAKAEPTRIHVNQPDLGEAERNLLEKFKIQSVLLLPLVLRDHSIGCIALSDNREDQSFSVRDVALGMSIVSLAATAVENARLYLRLKEYADELESRVQERTRQLQEATEHIEGILALVPDPVFVLNAQNQLERTNQAGEQLQRQAQEIRLNLFDPELLQVLEQGSLPTMQSLVEVQGKAYQVVFSALGSEYGHSSRKILVFRDVTRFRELDQMKTRFVSDVSHELRTPLTNLTLYLDLLSNTEDSARRRNYLQTLQRETGRLTHLIEDLLTISRLESGRTQFQIRSADINSLIDTLVSDRAFFTAQKNIHLEFSPAPDLPPAFVDKNMIVQTVSNLLTNAANYTQPGGSIRVSTACPEPGWITIQIADTGVGISPDEIDHIFERFYRGNASRITGAEGTGLGLAISQEIIQRMGGKITLESEPGSGSTFTVWLPQAEN